MTQVRKAAWDGFNRVGGFVGKAGIFVLMIASVFGSLWLCTFISNHMAQDRVTQGILGLLMLPLCFLFFLVFVFIGIAAAMLVVLPIRSLFPKSGQHRTNEENEKVRPGDFDSLSYDPSNDTFKFNDAFKFAGTGEKSGAGALVFFSVCGILISFFCLWLYFRAADKLNWNSLGWFGFIFLCFSGLLIWSIQFYRHPRRHHPITRAVIHGRVLSPQWSIAITFILVAVIETVAVGNVILTARFLEKTITVPGIVTRSYLEQTGFGRYGPHYSTFLEVRYKTDDGRERTEVCRKSHQFGFFLPVVGDSVNVVYNPLNPTNVDINDFMVLWGDSLFFGLLGIFLGVAGQIRFMRT